MTVGYNRHLVPVRVTVVIPTLAAGPCLLDCLTALAAQEFTGFAVVVVDNSGSGAARRALAPVAHAVEIVENPSNLGFGEAVNRGFLAFPSEYLAVLNDDAVPAPAWLGRLVATLDNHPRTGMAASRILQAGTDLLDSAGLGIALDGSSKQIGRGRRAPAGETTAPALIPSGCAALYRKAMLDEIGLFEPAFFLYCEDTDLALRGHWAGWSALYVPTAVVQHRYSASAGRASSLKAYLVERNRLRLAVRCLPVSWLAAAPFASCARYFWHAVAALRGRGKAAEFARQDSAWKLPWLVLKAHIDLFAELPRLVRERRALLRRVSAAEFAARLRRHLVSLREVASQ